MSNVKMQSVPQSDPFIFYAIAFKFVFKWVFLIASLTLLAIAYKWVDLFLCGLLYLFK